MLHIIFEPSNNRVGAYFANKEIGKCTYFEAPEKVWNIDHTIVDSEYGGQGIASKLFFELVSQARFNNIKINPICSFAVKAFEKNPGLKDMLYIKE